MTEEEIRAQLKAAADDLRADHTTEITLLRAGTVSPVGEGLILDRAALRLDVLDAVNEVLGDG